MYPLTDAICIKMHEKVIQKCQNEIILEVFKFNLNHLHLYEKKYWGLSGYKKNNQGRRPKLSVQQKRNFLRQTKRLQEEMGNFFFKEG